jgi:hypothetical protein
MKTVSDEFRNGCGNVAPVALMNTGEGVGDGDGLAVVTAVGSAVGIAVG